MARPTIWKRWNKNSVISIIENQETFEKYFLKPQVCIEDTPKQWALFNLWLKKGFLDKEEELVPYIRISKIKKIEHKSHRYAKTGLVNLKFIEYLAAIKYVYFSPYEKEILKIIIFDKRERLISRSGGRFLDKVRDFLLEIALIRLNRTKLELEEWTTSNPDRIKDYIHYFDSISLEIQLEGIRGLLKTKKDIESGKTYIVLNVPPTPINVAYHLIHIIPLTLVIKIFRMYLPFFIADELLRECIEKIKLEQFTELEPKKISYKITEIKKPRTKFQKAREKILKEYNKYRNTTPLTSS